MSYIENKHIQSDLQLSMLNSFGANEGATFYLYVSRSNSNNLFVGLSDEGQIENIWDSKFDYHLFCQKNTYNVTVFNKTIDVRQNNQLNATLDFSGVLTPIFVVCDTNDTDINISVLFKNQKSYLESRHKLLLATTPLHSALFLATAICLILSLVSRRIIFMKFHIYMIVTIIFQCMECFIEFLYYLQERTNPDTTHPFIFHYAVKHFAVGSLYTMLSLAAGGWQIHTVRFNVITYVVSLFCGLFTASTDIFSRYLLPIESEISTYFVKIFSLIIFTKVTSQELRKCEQYLQSYTLVVDSVGIDSRTTPLHRRSLMQYIFLCSFTTYFILKVAIFHIPLYFPALHEWIISLVTHGIENILLIVLTINYMPWKLNPDDWYSTFDDESKFVDCAMEDFNPEGLPTLKKRYKWTSGDKIPLPPLISETDYRIPNWELSEKEVPLMNN